MTDQSSPNPISPVGYSIDAGQTQLPPHLLIVEDDAGTQKLLQHLLGSDYRLTISQNGEEALELLRQYTFDLVLLDLRMPRVDGFEVLRVLRQRVNALHTPVIVTSAVTERDIIVRALSMGANDYVNKPIDLDILNARIQTQLALKKLMLTQEAKTETIAMTRDLQRQLSRIISHDIQSPLTNFRLGHFMLRDLIGDHVEAGRILENMELSLSATIDMVQIFVEAIESQELRPIFAPVDGNALILDVITQHQLTAQHKQITLTVDSFEGFLWGDQRMLRQCLNNLISNALKFSHPHTHAHVWGEKRGDLIRISVRDHGPGIAEEDRASLFGMFNKLRNRPTGGESSSGLGLWIVKHLINLHQGQCGMDSPEGAGSIFWIEVPMALP